MASIDDKNDLIFVNRVPHLVRFIKTPTWFGDQPQQVYLSAAVKWPTSKAGAADSVDDTLDYSIIYSSLTQEIPKTSDIFQLGGYCAQRLSKVLDRPIEGELTITAPKLLAQSSAELSIKIGFSGEPLSAVSLQELQVQHLSLDCIIGIGELERVQRQRLIIDLTLRRLAEEDARFSTFNLPPFSVQDPICSFVRLISQRVQDGEFQTIEAVGHNIAKFVLTEHDIACRITIKITKPAIFSGCDGPGICITRSAGDYVREHTPDEEDDVVTGT